MLRHRCSTSSPVLNQSPTSKSRSLWAIKVGVSSHSFHERLDEIEADTRSALRRRVPCRNKIPSRDILVLPEIGAFPLSAENRRPTPARLAFSVLSSIANRGRSSLLPVG